MGDIRNHGAFKGNNKPAIGNLLLIDGKRWANMGFLLGVSTHSSQDSFGCPHSSG